MKNADRINFYIAGLRQPGTADENAPAIKEADRTPVSEQLDGLTSIQKSSAPHRTLKSDLSAELSLPERLLEVEAGRQQQVLDQAQLQRLLNRLDQKKARENDWREITPEAERAQRRRLVFGLSLAVIIIAAQAVAVGWLYQRTELLLGRPLSASLLWMASTGDIDVTFRPSASAGDVAVLLRELDLHIVDGPNAASRYVLRPEVGADSKKALNTLRDRRDLVYSAEAAY